MVSCKSQQCCSFIAQSYLISTILNDLCLLPCNTVSVFAHHTIVDCIQSQFFNLVFPLFGFLLRVNYVIKNLNFSYDDLCCLVNVNNVNDFDSLDAFNSKICIRSGEVWSKEKACFFHNCDKHSFLVISCSFFSFANNAKGISLIVPFYSKWLT